MPSVLRLTTENLKTSEERARYTVAVIGCGQKAFFAAVAFAEAGFKVKCTDADQSVTRSFSKGNIKLGNRELETKLKSFARSEKIVASSDLKTVIAASDIIILAVDAKVDENKAVDYSEVQNICKQVGATLQKNCLFISAGIGGFGFTEEVARINLENTSGLKVGADFGLAYSFLTGPTQHRALETGMTELMVAADDNLSLESAAMVLECIAPKGVKKVLGMRMAELAAIFDALAFDSKVALANELAAFCEAAGIDCVDVFKRMDSGCRDLMQPAISEVTSRTEEYMLLENAENLGAKLRLPTLVRQVNEDMLRHAVNLTQDAMRSIGKPLRRSKIVVLGASLDSGSGHSVFVDMLEAKGANVTLYDPQCSTQTEQAERLVFKRTLTEATEGKDCVIVFSDQEQFKRLNLKKLHMLMKSRPALVDLTLQLDPEKVEGAGFVYRGLGRGVWKK